MLTAAGCGARLERFRDYLATRRLDAALVTDARDLYYLFGVPLPDYGLDLPGVAYVTPRGAPLLLLPSGVQPLLETDLAHYDWHVGYTLNTDTVRAVAAAAKQQFRGRAADELGFQAESLPHWLAVELAAVLDPAEGYAIDDDLADLQRAKDPDEVACIQAAIDATLAAYDAVQPVIQPGVPATAVLAAGQAAALTAAGRPLLHGGDYNCGHMAGKARPDPLLDGESYIIDGQTTLDGYRADLSRTFSVGTATDLQQEVYAHLRQILLEVPEHLRPGASGFALARWMDARIRQHPHLAERGLVHHAGHGLGLRPHTAPDLNLGREGILRVGDVVSVEPGAYSPELRAGVRLENSYLITADGCELLSDYPLELAPRRS